VPAKEDTTFLNGLNEEEILHVDNGTNELKMKVLFEKKTTIN
jgi:hypothetical protein